MTTRLIGICSPAMASGKSTVAEYLVNRHGFVRVAFAAPIKRMISTALEVSGYSTSVIRRVVHGDLKEQPLAVSGAFPWQHADRMLDALGPVPAEVSMSGAEIRRRLKVWGDEHFRNWVTSRRLQQTLGSEWGRDQIHPDLWLLIARDRARDLRARGRNVVIDDMRFPNEMEMVLAEGGEVRRIVRPGAQVTVAHASEGQLDAIHMPEVWNTSTVEDLYAATERSLLLR